jgi:AcrR family transcriptional regulator
MSWPMAEEAGERPLPRGRHRLSREAVEESQRRRLLDAIVELVAQDGYANTAVGDIAARAGVSRTTFYELFDGKYECFAAAYDDVTASLIDAIVAAALDAGDDGRARLGAGIDAYLEWCAAHPAAAGTFIVAVHTAGPEALEHRADVLRRFCQVIADAAPGVRPAAAAATIASIDAMAHDLIRQGRAAELPALADDARYVAGRLLG